jgi:hypothetical protein
MENAILSNLASALSKAQGEMPAASKTGYNPHFRSHFSTLEDLIEVSRPALTKYGLSVCQYPHSDNDSTYLVTKLKHSSGQEEVSQVKIFLKDPSDIQKLGSAMSYLKRYAYASICGIATSENEDDGNSVSQPSESKPSDTVSPKQLALLRARLSDKKELEKKICTHYKISSLEQLPWKYMNEVVGILDKTSSSSNESV